jgi:hypothetical protein
LTAAPCLYPDPSARAKPNAGELTMENWEYYVDLLKPAGKLFETIAAPATEQLRGELYRQLTMNIAQGYFMLFQASDEHPEFAPFENSVFLAQPNPDAVYYYTPLDGRGTYRVLGNRGNAPVAGFAIGGNMIGLADPPGPGYDNYDFDGLALEADGSFEVIFSPEKPAGYEGNWRYLNPAAKFLLIRQFSYDWGRERDVRAAIERLDAPPLKPQMTPEQTDKKLRALFGGYVERLSKLCIGQVRRTRDKGLVNKVALTSFQDMGNGNDWPQAYWETVFELHEDDAVIIETELPEQHHYWNVQVIDPLWNQVELVYRQTSLNGLQARLDSDGKFRAVLSVRDPGVQNWLDTGGNLTGMLIGRWYRCSSYPVPVMKRVKFANLRAELADDTPEFSETERAEMLKTRRIGAQLRRRW